MALDFEVRFKGKTFQLNRSKFASKFVNFFVPIKAKQKSNYIDIKNTRLNKALINVFENLKKYSLEDNESLENIFENVNVYDLYLSVNWNRLNNPEILRFAIDTMKSNISKANYDERLKFAQANNIQEVKNACKQFIE